MARNTGRFNKILEFIGLVDDDQDEEMDRRPSGAQTYTPSSRRTQDARPVRPSQGGSYAYDDRRSQGSGGRYAAPERDYNPRYASSSARPQAGGDYGARYGGSYKSGDYTYNRAAASARPDYERVTARPDYKASSARPDDYGRASARPAYDAPPARSRLEDEFERPEPQQRPARGNVVSMRAEQRPQTVIYYLHALEECRDVICDLLDNKTVLLNLEDMDERLIQRGIDTLCGAAFALNATLRKASDKTYLIAPNSVEVALTNDAERRY